MSSFGLWCEQVRTGFVDAFSVSASHSYSSLLHSPGYDLCFFSTGLALMVSSISRSAYGISTFETMRPGTSVDFA